jgi:sugar-specific transcriptional regulator TrmB
MTNLKPELIKKIRDYFNLNIYETKVWLVLLSRGISSAGEIAEMSGVPRSRTYDVLESLEKQGFAISKIGKPAKYIAVKPAVILEKIKLNTMREAEEKVKVLAKLKDSSEYSELESIYNTGIKPIKHEDLSASLKGKSTIYNQAREMLENAKKEIIICTTYRDFYERSRMFLALTQKLARNNVAVKIALSGDESEIKKLSIKLKIKIKPIKINAKFFIIDSEQILFFLSENSPAEEEIAIWINASFFVNSMAFFFNQIWKD